jgi:hypothetical protein
MTHVLIGLNKTGKPKVILVTDDGDAALQKYKDISATAGKSGKTTYTEILLSNLRSITRRRKWKTDATNSD